MAVQQLYTPFLADIGKEIGRYRARESEREEEEKKRKLYQSAYMKQPGALERLAETDPKSAMEIEKYQSEQEQQKLTTTREEEDRKIKAQEQLRKIINEEKTNIAKTENYQQGKRYFDQQLSTHKDLIEAAGYTTDQFRLNEQDYEQAKQVFGKPGGAAPFMGTGETAQISNMLIKGVDDPNYRKSPEYARAWQLANEPKIIRTERGDIKLTPDLPAIFKPPQSADIPEDKQMKSIINNAETDAEINSQMTRKNNEPSYIPGTEKPEKFTEGEKLSAGYFERMRDAENRIATLIKENPKFNPSSWSETLSGITNITASEELQSYRQSSSDWIRAKLRKESGTVIGEDEMNKEYETYFPVFGDWPSVIKQKERARQIATESMRKNAGQAIKDTPKESALGTPKPGDIVQGYRFKGGNPADPNSWEKQ